MVDGKQQSCELAAVDVTGGKAGIKDGLCNLSLTPHGTAAIEVSGTLKTAAFSDTFARRQANAAVGQYTKELGSGVTVELAIEASSDDALTLSYRQDGVDVVSHATAKRSSPCLDVWELEMEGCIYRVGLSRYEGRFLPFVYASVTNNSNVNACADRW